VAIPPPEEWVLLMSLAVQPQVSGPPQWLWQRAPVLPGSKPAQGASCKGVQQLVQQLVLHVGPGPATLQPSALALPQFPTLGL
jgi:hypothetical protein